jgi:hypothetical protein
MLDIHGFIRVWIGRFAACFCSISCVMAPLAASPFVCADDDEPIANTVQLAQEMSEEQDLHELVRLIVQFRNDMVARGCVIPRLTALLEIYRSQLYEYGLNVDDEVFDQLWQEFAKYESGMPVHPMKHKHKHKKEEVKISGKTAVGFLKFLGGSLLCLVPVPIIQGAGASLAVIGINDMMNAARDEKQERKAEERLEENQRLNRQLEN